MRNFYHFSWPCFWTAEFWCVGNSFSTRFSPHYNYNKHPETHRNGFNLWCCIIMVSEKSPLLLTCYSIQSMNFDFWTTVVEAFFLENSVHYSFYFVLCLWHWFQLAEITLQWYVGIKLNLHALSASSILRLECKLHINYSNCLVIQMCMESINIFIIQCNFHYQARMIGCLLWFFIFVTLLYY